MITRTLRSLARRANEWLLKDEPQPKPPFDNGYTWRRWQFKAFMQDPVCQPRPAYVWGVLQGAALGKVLGMRRVSMIEFGVAGGAGLLAMQRAAELCQREIGIGIDVYGFDTGQGLPKPIDYRDCPYMWSDGYFPMDVPRLRAQLRGTELILGLVNETVREFLQRPFAPVAFISFDLDFYSSTRDALAILDAGPERLLPRVFCYFDDIAGHPVSEYAGERLAISDFNAAHAHTKLSPYYGLRDYIPRPYENPMWADMFYIAYCFQHPLYGLSDCLRPWTTVDLTGRVTTEAPR